VLPAATPETSPVELTLAIAVFALLHVPPETEADKDVELPGQTVVVPLIVPPTGSGFTVTGIQN
jgi:hypothetical protein